MQNLCKLKHFLLQKFNANVIKTALRRSHILKETCFTRNIRKHWFNDKHIIKFADVLQKNLVNVGKNMNAKL